MDKVKLIRMPTRSGLMRTRMAGVHEARAEVLTFLDSHVEATEGWLEPLLERIKLNPKAVPCPVIEEVNDKTMQYKVGDSTPWLRFNVVKHWFGAVFNRIRIQPKISIQIQIQDIS